MFQSVAGSPSELPDHGAGCGWAPNSTVQLWEVLASFHNEC